MSALINRFPDNKRERFKLPEVNKVVDDITAQGIAAIEKERVDCLILVNEAMQTFKDEVKQRIDKAGYGEITIIGGFAAAVEMAKSMVNLKLIQLRRAYPNDAMLAKPEFY
jgi:Asp/Glu/hydantoin racemase